MTALLRVSKEGFFLQLFPGREESMKEIGADVAIDQELEIYEQSCFSFL